MLSGSPDAFDENQEQEQDDSAASKETKLLSCHCKNKVIMVLGNEISLICGRNFIVVESFSGQLSGADGCNGILLLETAVGVVGIIA